MAHDLVIRNAHLVDGTGAAARAADIAIDGDRITAIGDLSAATAKREIDASGLVVSPGFIDLHTHLDAQVAWVVAVGVHGHGEIGAVDVARRGEAVQTVRVGTAVGDLARFTALAMLQHSDRRTLHRRALACLTSVISSGVKSLPVK